MSLYKAKRQINDEHIHFKKKCKDNFFIDTWPTLPSLKLLPLLQLCICNILSLPFPLSFLVFFIQFLQTSLTSHSGWPWPAWAEQNYETPILTHFSTQSSIHPPRPSFDTHLDHQTPIHINVTLSKTKVTLEKGTGFPLLPVLSYWWILISTMWYWISHIFSWQVTIPFSFMLYLIFKNKIATKLK